MLTANLPTTRPPNRRRVARQPVIIEGRLLEPQVTVPERRVPAGVRLIHVVLAIGLLVVVGFTALWLVTQ